MKFVDVLAGRGDFRFRLSKKASLVTPIDVFYVFFFFFRVPPSFNMLKIQAGEQEKNQKYIYIYIYICIYIYIFFFVLGALQCIRAVICASCKK